MVVFSFSFTLLKSQWLYKGGSFSTGENQANLHIHMFSEHHDRAHPQNALVILVLASPKQRLTGMLQDARQ